MMLDNYRQQILLNLYRSGAAISNSHFSLGPGAMAAMFKIFKPREERVMIFGNDSCGKTTLLYNIKLGEIVTTIPTIGFNIESIEHKRRRFLLWDVGGKQMSQCSKSG